MQGYLNSIVVGLVVFPFLALVITVPYMVYQYRKLGSVPKWRSLLVYLFVFYLICAYFLAILPLPESRTALVPYAQTPQLVPFYFFNGLFVWSGFSISAPSTWIYAITNVIFLESAFNVLYMVPLGMFCRYYLKRKWWQALLIGFGFSLFLELSQLSGLYGIYEFPYRLFDVDDLILNTFGCVLGFWFIGPAAKLLPNMTVIDQEAREQGIRASLMKRMISFLFDLIIAEFAFVAFVVLPSLFGLWTLDLRAIAAQVLGAQAASGALAMLVISQIVFWLLFFILVPAFFGGQTLGQRALRLVVVGPDAGAVSWQRVLARNGLMLAALVTPVVLLGMILNISPQEASEFTVFTSYLSEQKVALLAVVAFFALVWLASIPLRNFQEKRKGRSLVMFNELVSGTRIMTQQGAESLRDRLVVLDVAEVAALEYMIAKDGPSLAELMERSGLAVSKAIRERNPKPTGIVVLCGSGNNGGDGWVVARDLALRGYEVAVVSTMLPTEVEAEPARSAAMRAFSALKKDKVEKEGKEPRELVEAKDERRAVSGKADKELRESGEAKEDRKAVMGKESKPSWELLEEKASLRVVVRPSSNSLRMSLEKAEVIVDALLGTGFSGQEIREPFSSWINAVNEHRAARKDAFVVAIDVPSGYSAQTGEHASPCMKADMTVTMLAYKPGMLASEAQKYCGTVKLARLTDISPYLDRFRKT